ncbi:hypothetical protein PTKIN_Ptkin10aG0036000 [Pterospermum kingtungense]
MVSWRRLISSCPDQIVERAVELIHQNEVVLTFGRSRTVRNFLVAATKKNRSFQVFVAKGAPKSVIVGVHAVMANGGVIGHVGLNMIALAAKRHAVPFVVVAGCHKLCPLYPNNPEVLLNEMKSPSELLDFGEVSDCMDYGIGSGEVMTPRLFTGSFLTITRQMV